MFNSYILISLLSLVLSAYFSSTEIAYIVTNKLKIKILSKKDSLVGRSIAYFSNNSNYFFTTILIGNNIVNITFSTLATIMLTNYLSDIGILILSTIILLLFGEIIPKVIAREIPDTYLAYCISPLYLFNWTIRPIVQIFSFISNIFIIKSKISEENIYDSFSKKDIEKIVEESKEAGIVNEKESNIISNILEISQTKVGEIVRPRTEIVGIEVNQTIDDLITLHNETGYSKFPVYEKNLDNIVGYVLALDCLNNPSTLSEIIRDIIYIPESKKVTEALKDFTAKKVSIAVVIDEFGGTSGIITLEDIVEELFGDIKDEYDDDEYICKELPNKHIIASGMIEIEDFNTRIKTIQLPEGNYETISGFITFHSGKIPQKNEIITINNLRFHIIKSDGKKIDLVKIELLS
jgi:CBS domain containing-hemolysin-like protein